MPLPTSELVCCPCNRDTSLDDVQGVTRNLASAPLLWCNRKWPPCTGHSSQREDKGGCRAGRLLACGLVNPTTNRKTAKQNGTMAHQDQRARKSPGLPRAIINIEAKPKLQLKLCFRQRERNQCRRKRSPPQFASMSKVTST